MAKEGRRLYPDVVKEHFENNLKEMSTFLGQG